MAEVQVHGPIERTPSSAPPTAPAAMVGLGVLLGVAWAASLRGYMAQLAGPESAFTWAGTFGAVIAPGAVVGGLLGWAEQRRRIGAVRGRRWLALSPLLLAVTPLLLPGAVRTLVTTGLGSGAIGLTLLGMLGGYALSGRGRRWLRGVSGVMAFSLVPVSCLGVVGGPREAWMATLLAALFVALAVACAIPLREPVEPVGAPTRL